MNRLMIRAAAVAATLLVGWAVTAGPVEDEIAERIKKVGNVCVQGDDCASASTADVASVDAGGGIQSTYDKTCATCHNAGVAGAPKLGDTAAWEDRLAKGMDELYASAVNGLPPAMPAKGMCFQCSEDDLKALVDYMVDTVE